MSTEKNVSTLATTEKPKREKTAQEIRAERFEKEQNLKRLRKDGVLTRQQFRRMMFDHGFNLNPNKNPWSPEYTEYSIEKNKKTSTKEVVSKIKLWQRF